MNLFTAVVIAALVAIIALLWYGVRTHKTAAQLKAKVDAQAQELAQKSKDALGNVKP